MVRVKWSSIAPPPRTLHNDLRRGAVSALDLLIAGCLLTAGPAIFTQGGIYKNSKYVFEHTGCAVFQAEIRWGKWLLVVVVAVLVRV